MIGIAKYLLMVVSMQLLLMSGPAPRSVCSDKFNGSRPPERLPMQIQLGVYEVDAPLAMLQSWQALVDCDIAVYEDTAGTKRYATGSFWEPKNALQFAEYLRSRGVLDAEVFVFAHDHIRIVGWGNYVDYGQRIQ